MCDNLSLPFRDESFDAVLSVAVVHHFATTERRVCALRELARILRIGGRLIISVWAMEQQHRRFESQDVLVPWHRPQTLSTPSLELTSTTNTSEEDVMPYHAYTQTSDSDSNRSASNRKGTGPRRKGRTRHKGRSIDPDRSSSPSSSSLSSPNETCYSFVRRAIQKLAGSKRSGASHRPWFLETWNSCTKEPPHNRRYDPDGCEAYDCGNVHDLPIELRRVDDDEPPQRRQTFPSSMQPSVNDLYATGVKSKSLTNIKTLGGDKMVRSRSSVPSLQGDGDGDCPVEEDRDRDETTRSTRSLSKPKLVKQKQSICEEDADEALDEPTDMKDLVRALPDFRTQHGQRGRGRGRGRGAMFKQRSMNEELMSTDRLREKERLRQNIQKQASLNEELIYQRHTLDSIRDSIFAVSTSKRFQLIKSGFTNTLKNSTTNIGRVDGASLKNGFVRMFQGWKTTELIVSPTNVTDPAEAVETAKIELVKTSATPAASEEGKGATVASGTTIVVAGERRHSKEDGSDSSKDSSLQSDTSVDSEDSFASVIFIPKTDPLSPTPLSPGPTSPRLAKQSSVPNSPRVKQSSCPTSPRIKSMPLTVYPLTKQLSSPKPSTTTKTPYKPTSPNIENILNARDQLEEPFNTDLPLTSPTPDPPQPTSPPRPDPESLAQKYSVVQIPKFKFKKPVPVEEIKKSLTGKELDGLPEDKKRSERLRQIRELLNQRPGFGIRSSRSAFPIVRHASTNSNGKNEPIVRPLPRLLSLELFNPETDDKDSDSSGVSSPDSVDSVINIECSETGHGKASSCRVRCSNVGSFSVPEKPKTPSPTKFTFPPVIEEEQEEQPRSLLQKPDEPDLSKLSPTSMSLLEAAANVASSLDEAVETVIQSSPRARRKQLEPLEAKEVLEVMERSYGCDAGLSPGDDESARLLGASWDEECHRHLTDFADKLSEKLLQEIDQYQEASRRQEQREVGIGMSSKFLGGYQHIDDPYIHRLSEELEDLNKLSAEIQKQNEFLSKLSKAEPRRECAKCGATKPSKQCKCSVRIHSGLSEGSDRVGCEGDKRLSRESSDASEAQEVGKSLSSVATSASTSIHFGHSIDSNDTVDLSASGSDSQKDTNSVSRFSDGGSTASLRSCSEWNHVPKLPQAEACPERAATQGRSRSRSRSGEDDLSIAEQLLPENYPSVNTSLSDDTSQDSLPSDNIGGSITYHRYYHVFREGELDQLIERYVENLHIISSYYDHASWCVVAEKVQVWTI